MTIAVRIDHSILDCIPSGMLGIASRRSSNLRRAARNDKEAADLSVERSVSDHGTNSRHTGVSTLISLPVLESRPVAPSIA